jgi:hypothetical protein
MSAPDSFITATDVRTLLPELHRAFLYYFATGEGEAWQAVLIEAHIARRQYNLERVTREILETMPEADVEKTLEDLLSDVECTSLATVERTKRLRQ